MAVTGTDHGALDYEFVETVAGGQLCEQFNPPVPASGTDMTNRGDAARRFRRALRAPLRRTGFSSKGGSNGR